MRRLPTREGFTLIELLMVIVIIGLLATIAMQVFWRAKNRGFEAAMQSDLKSAAVHQERYFEKHVTYAPSDANLTDFAASPGVTLSITYAQSDGWAGIVTHVSAMRNCGLLVGAAPAGSAGPATAPGVVECGAVP
jgi:prepilin-type N-terminal cleavage/methylation domain-containing protein